jgi:predicted Ser/Thr protein kinase
VKPLAKSRTQARVKSQPKSLTQALKALTAEQSTVLAQLVLAKLKETRNDREKKANVHPQAPRT